MSSSSSEESDYSETDYYETETDYDETETIPSEFMEKARQELRDSLRKLEKDNTWGVIESGCSDCNVNVKPYIFLREPVCGFSLVIRFDDTTTVKHLLERFESRMKDHNEPDMFPDEWDNRSMVDLDKTHKLMHNDTTDLLEHPNATLNVLGVKSEDTVFIRHKSALIPFAIKIMIKGGPNAAADECVEVVLMPGDTPRDVKEKIKIQAGIKSTENCCLCIVSQNFHFQMMKTRPIAAYGFLKCPQQKQQEKDEKKPTSDNGSYLCTENKMYLCFNAELHKRVKEVTPEFISNPHVSEYLGEKQPYEEKKALGILLPTTLQLKSQIAELVAVEEGKDIGKNIVEFTPEKNIFSASPTGGDIKNKCHLEEYLYVNLGSPSLSESDEGSGESPRLSTRISKKKAIETPEGEKPKKQKKHAQGNISSGKGKAGVSESEVDASTVEGRVFIDVAMKEADNVRR